MVQSKRDEARALLHLVPCQRARIGCQNDIGAGMYFPRVDCTCRQTTEVPSPRTPKHEKANTDSIGMDCVDKGPEIFWPIDVLVCSFSAFPRGSIFIFKFRYPIGKRCRRRAPAFGRPGLARASPRPPLDAPSFQGPQTYFRAVRTSRKNQIVDRGKTGARRRNSRSRGSFVDRRSGT